jgi:hypothetical protein
MKLCQERVSGQAVEGGGDAAGIIELRAKRIAEKLFFRADAI